MGLEITQSVGLVDSLPMLDKLMDAVATSQEIFGKFTQEQVDLIFTKCSMAANQARIKLAKMAVEEGGMGNLEDKTIKNHFASEFVHNTYRDTKTCGVIERDVTGGLSRYAEPIGVLAGIIPCTNPTSTTIFKSLVALKSRNCIVFSPHPRTAKCTIEAAKLVRDVAIANGAPPDCIGWIDIPSVELCNELMRHDKTVMVVATGASGLVKAAYSSGKPALGGGAGNTPVIIDETADIETAVNSILLSKTFDYGMICASEQAVIAVESVAQQVKDCFLKRGAYFLNDHQKQLVGDFIFTDKGALNPAAVGQPAWKLAQLAGVEEAPQGCRCLIAELTEVGPAEQLSHEKLCPCLGFFVVRDFEQALERGLQMVQYGGMGHTSVLYTDLNGPEKESRVAKFQSIMPTGRTLICMPTSHGAIGDVFNFRQKPSLSLGCGSWGHNATAENLQVKHLLNIKEICERREHILWFKVPRSIYFNRGTVTEAFAELKGDNLRTAFIVTDQGVKNLGYVSHIVTELHKYGIDADVFAEVTQRPDLRTVAAGVQRMNMVSPDVVIALGGACCIDLAKVMRLAYEHPDASFDHLYTRFMDAHKRIVRFPRLGGKVKKVVCIPTTSGIGTEMTPFAVVLDTAKNQWNSIADYSLTPDMTIMDANFVLSMPTSLAGRGGWAAIVNALESYVSMLATDYTQALSLRALKLLFSHLEKSVQGDAKAREACHNAAAIAGMAYANAFLGICHSIAHQLSAFLGIPHGTALSLLICQTVKFNAEDAPSKQGTFPQYSHPKAKGQYAELADGLGLCCMHPGLSLDEKVDCLIEMLNDMKTALAMPTSIKEYGISEEVFFSKLDDMALHAFDDQCTSANPRYPLVAELRQILIDAYYGKVRQLGLATVIDCKARQDSLDMKLRAGKN